MTSTMNYKKWDIILVYFPFTNLKSKKKRPALIISPDEYNEGTDIIIAFITSKLNTFTRMGDYKIKEWKKANLPKPSMIRMKFATVSKKIIDKKLGRLHKKDIETFKSRLIDFLN